GADVVGGVNEVDDAATVFEVVVAGDVAGLEVEVDEADRLAVPGRDPGEVDRCRGGAHPAFGAGQADDPAAPPPDRKVQGRCFQVAAQGPGPFGCAGDTGFEFFDCGVAVQQAARPRLDHAGEEVGGHLVGDEDDRELGTVAGDVTDEVEHRQGTEVLVDQDDVE